MGVQATYVGNYQLCHFVPFIELSEGKNGVISSKNVILTIHFCKKLFCVKNITLQQNEGGIIRMGNICRS